MTMELGKGKRLIGCILWILIGVGLLLRAFFYWKEYPFEKTYLAYIAIVTVLAWLKSDFILKKTVLRHLSYLSNSPPFYKFYPPLSWLVIFFMMALGITIRRSHLPHIWIALILTWVGMALIIASRHYLILKRGSAGGAG